MRDAGRTRQVKAGGAGGEVRLLTARPFSAWVPDDSVSIG